VAAPEVPEVDISQIIEDAVRTIANAICMGHLEANFGQTLHGADERTLAGIRYIYTSYQALNNKR
jgi:hypothetical protein